ncbi:MAG: hypothetical protein R3E68_18980 [Burkholderiaceae bacterium]
MDLAQQAQLAHAGDQLRHVVAELARHPRRIDRLRTGEQPGRRTGGIVGTDRLQDCTRARRMGEDVRVVGGQQRVGQFAGALRQAGPFGRWVGCRHRVHARL